jgi:type VI secretion system FHA domain protein
MPLILTIISSHKVGLGDAATRAFGISGGTIGRSTENDWVLPDSKRYVSSRHCTIDFRGGGYYLIDTSTNGVYVNDADIPVGRGNPQRLFAGDRLQFGEYQIQVQIEGDQTLEMLAHDSRRKAVDQAQQVAPPDPTGDDLLQVTDAPALQQLLDEHAA